jgi:hypothetical protein
MRRRLPPLPTVQEPETVQLKLIASNSEANLKHHDLLSFLGLLVPLPTSGAVQDSAWLKTSFQRRSTSAIDETSIEPCCSQVELFPIKKLCGPKPLHDSDIVTSYWNSCETSLDIAEH